MLRYVALFFGRRIGSTLFVCRVISSQKLTFSQITDKRTPCSGGAAAGRRLVGGGTGWQINLKRQSLHNTRYRQLLRKTPSPREVVGRGPVSNLSKFILKFYHKFAQKSIHFFFGVAFPRPRAAAGRRRGGWLRMIFKMNERKD